MRTEMWVVLVCCCALMVLLIPEGAVAEDISRDVDTSTKIGCGILESRKSFHDGAERYPGEQSFEEEDMENRESYAPTVMAQGIMALGMVVDEIAKVGGVIRLGMG